LGSAPSSGESRLQRQRRRQLLEAARSRYQSLSYQEKGALVDELVELSGYHRKSVLRLLRQQPADQGGPQARAGADHDSAAALGRRRYGPEVVQLLETLWEASDHRCGKRLAAVLPTLVVAIETMVTWRFDRFSRHCCCSGARPRPIGCWHRLALPRTVSNGSGGCGS